MLRKKKEVQDTIQTNEQIKKKNLRDSYPCGRTG